MLSILFSDCELSMFHSGLIELRVESNNEIILSLNNNLNFLNLIPSGYCS